jgi:NAD(P)-dependent dehydrogenase (short-subunit alcohol dehydrogenase family)
MTKVLADELGPQGVNVTVVHPGITRTESTTAILEQRAAADKTSSEEIEKRFAASTLIGRLLEAEEVADVVAFLASPRSVAINGDAIAAGGGTPRTIHY